MEKKKKKFYAVAKGLNSGIFSAWFGPAGAQAQIKGFAGARYKGFLTIEEARQWLEQMETEKPPGPSSRKKSGIQGKAASPAVKASVKAGEVVIYTDGGCS